MKFDVENKEHRTLMRQQLANFGNPEHTYVMISCLDYIDALENRVAFLNKGVPLGDALCKVVADD